MAKKSTRPTERGGGPPLDPALQAHLRRQLRRRINNLIESLGKHGRVLTADTKGQRPSSAAMKTCRAWLFHRGGLRTAPTGVRLAQPTRFEEPKEWDGPSLPLRVRDALDWVEQHQGDVVEAMAEEIEGSLVHFIERQHRESVLGARVVVERWPYPEQLAVGRALAYLLENAVRAEARTRRSSRLPAREQFPSRHGLPYWHDTVPPTALAAWAARELDALLTPEEASKSLASVPAAARAHAKPVAFGEALRLTVAAGSNPAGQTVPLRRSDGRQLRVPIAGVALLWLAVKLSERRERESPYVVVSTARPVRARGNRPGLRHSPPKGPEAFSPLASTPLSLAIPRALADLHGKSALREWLVLQYLFTRESWKGRLLWTMDDHLAALDLPWLRGDSSRKRQIMETMRRFTCTQLCLGADVEQRPLIALEDRVLIGSEPIDGATLIAHECLLPGRSGWHEPSSRTWAVAPRSILGLSVRPGCQAHALALALAVAFAEEGQSLARPGGWFLEVAGASAGRPGRFFAQLPGRLDELRAAGLIGHWGPRRRKLTSASQVTVTQALSLRHLDLRDCLPISKRAPRTGCQLQRLREEREMTQRRFARHVGTSERQLRQWERLEGEPLSRSARQAVSENFLFID